MRRFPRLTALLALVAVPTALVVAACVGDDPANGGTPTGDGGPNAEGGPGVDGESTKPTLVVATASKSIPLLPSISAPLEVNITRGGGFAGAVKVSLTGLPGGTTAEAITVAANETKGTVTITASAAPSQGVAAIGISAQSIDGALGASAPLELVVRGLAGTLDTSFAGTGIVADASLYIQAIALQKDGKIVLGGSAPQSGAFADNYGAVRLDTSGKLDATFATAGRFKATVGSAAPGYSRYVTGVVIDEATGNMIVGGSAAISNELRLGAVRLDKNGKVDPTFGAAGAGGAIGPALARGVSVVGRGASTFITGFGSPVISGVVVAGKLGASGFDSSFGTGGMAKATGHNLSAHDAVVQSDGKILIGGASGAIGADTIATVVRLNADGTPDTNYGTNAEFHYDVTDSQEEIYGMAILPDDRVVIAGTKLGESSPAPALAEVYIDVIGVNGVADNTFGVPLPHVGDADGNSSATKVVVQSDGLIVLLGYAKKSGTYQAFVWRLLKSGAADPAFNNGTPIYRPIASGLYLPSGAVVDAYNRLVFTTEETVVRLWL